MKQFKISNKITDRTNESFKQYLKDISDIPMFTREEELECTKRASAGDKSAIDELVRRNLRFVISVAKQYATEKTPLEDLVNEGNIGLMLAAEKFTPDMGYKFISYAVWWVRKIILEHISKNGKTVRLPANKINDLSKFDKCINELEQKVGRNVDISEVIDAFGNQFSSDEFMFLDVINNYSMDSLDRQIGNEESSTSSLGDLFYDSDSKDTDSLITDIDLKNEVSNVLDMLKPRNKQIMISLFGLDGSIPKTLKEVSDEVGITREMVRQVKEKSLRLLRTNSRIRVAYDDLN